MTHPSPLPPRRAAGFSLIELLIAVAIISVLAASVGPMLMDKLREANNAALIDQIKTIKGAWQMFSVDTNHTTTRIESFGASVRHCNDRVLTIGRFGGGDGCTSEGTLIAGWKGPYFERPLVRADNKLVPGGGWDSWGNSPWSINNDTDYTDPGDINYKGVTLRWDSLTPGCLEAAFLDAKLDDGSLTAGYGGCKTDNPDWSAATYNAGGTRYFLSSLMR